MGCNIFSWCEIFDEKTGEWVDAGNVFPGREWEIERYSSTLFSEPFRDRNYRVFAFLAGVRDDHWCEPISPPRGVPEDWYKRFDGTNNTGFYTYYQQYDWTDFHSHSWLLLSELLAFDYDAPYANSHTQEKRAIEPGQLVGTYREVLPTHFFETLEVMTVLGAPEHVRVVFYFDG